MHTAAPDLYLAVCCTDDVSDLQTVRNSFEANVRVITSLLKVIFSAVEFGA